MLNKIIRILDSNYHNLSLWYSVFFSSGIAYFFEFRKLPNIIFLIAIFSLILLRNKIIKHLIFGIIIAFLFGAFCAKYRLDNIKYKKLDHQIECMLKGIVHSVEYTHSGANIIIDKPIFSELLLQEDYPSKVKIYLKKKFNTDLDIGDYIEIYASLFPPSGKIVLDGYDFERKNFFNNIGAVGYAASESHIIFKNSYSLRSYIGKVRKYIYKNLISNMGEENGNFAAALFLGKQAGIKYKILKDIRIAGLSHILCVSGLHMSLVFGFFFIVFRILLNCFDFIAWNFNVKTISASLSIIFSFFYLVLTDFGIASIRAYIMCLIVMVGVILERKTFSLRSVSIGIFIILTKNPEYIYYPSFQLSFVAVIILIAGFEAISCKNKSAYNLVIMSLLLNIYSSILVSLATIPIVIYHFFIISNYVVLSNLLIVPIVSMLVMPIGILSMASYLMFEASYLDYINSYLISIIIRIAEYIASLEYATYHFGKIDSSFLIIYIFGLLWLVIWKGTIRYLGLLVLIFSAACILINKDKPDVIINTEIGFISYIDKDLKIIGENLKEFHLEYISNYYGRQKYTYINTGIFKRKFFINSSLGNKLNIQFGRSNTYEVFFNGYPARTNKASISCEERGCILRWL